MKKLNIKSPVAILGYGAEGRAAFDFLKKQGVTDITICDEKDNLMMPAGVHSRLGEGAFDDLSQFKTIMRSPGIHYELPSILSAIESGAIITSLTRLALELAADHITAITGTNGKTTTTALTRKILEAHYGDSLIFGGNDGSPVLKEVMEHPNNPVLMEVSSFQFADLSLSPHISALLNITPNHLDWHVTLEDYTHAKENLFRHQNAEDWAVLNANEENSTRMAESTSAQILWVGKQKGKSWAAWKEGTLTVHHEGKEEGVIRHDQLLVKTHPDNLLFAAALAALHHVPVSTIAEQMKLFKGVAHRLEHIRTLNDIHFYNDSSSTSPESAMMAIDQFNPKHLILLLGGSSKKSDFSFLADKIKSHGVRVYLYGQEGETIQTALREIGAGSSALTYNTSGNFSQIIHDVHHLAKAEDNIVLSPACASFDMFTNAKERGTQFTRIVEGLE
ncbi:UDP-N-acetylmuramoyl-L-alanine--D-glutamate ligase [Candidatus Peregrinibacteria bacterium CG_4_10_14_0_2_um_filter_43_11]|nr:MAG: UDP-N-acetylmuramoyl-L-alanine--D-glutamate ligase [Candidatus Peregrinibacteria bacterium CG_4_10_14_0_2_um_filter_43_11]